MRAEDSDPIHRHAPPREPRACPSVQHSRRAQEGIPTQPGGARPVSAAAELAAAPPVHGTLRRLARTHRSRTHTSPDRTSLPTCVLPARTAPEPVHVLTLIIFDRPLVPSRRRKYQRWMAKATVLQVGECFMCTYLLVVYHRDSCQPHPGRRQRDAPW